MSGRLSPMQLAQTLQEAIRCHQDGRTAKAERLYREILAIDPGNLDAVHLTGVLAAQRRDYARAVEYIGRAAAIAPHLPQIQANLGKAYYGLDRIDDARQALEKAVELAPNLADAWNDLGNALRDLGRMEQAMASFARALKLAPNTPEPWANQADVMIDLAEYGHARTSLERALAINPQFPEAMAIRARLCLATGEAEAALAAAERSLALRPGYGEALSAKADALERLGRTAEAVGARAQALAADGLLIPRLLNKANVAAGQSLRAAALGYYDRVLALDPDNIPAHGQRAVELMLLKRLDEAKAAAERTLQLDPDNGYGHYVRGQVALQSCDWDVQAETLAHLRGLVARREASMSLSAFAFMNFDTTPAEQLACAEFTAQQLIPPEPREPAEPAACDRIRIAYLSADFHGHATAMLMAGLFERHDRSRFQIIGLSNGPTILDAMRERLLKAFDRFIDVRELPDDDVERLIRELGIDILVDLKGYTQGHRAGVVARRPAPVQVSFLGYPGTMGASFIDYLIADQVVIPPGEDDCYTEKVVRLPGSYQVNDNVRPIAEVTPSRAELGLPEAGFVFCSFNNTYKITRPVFEVWTRLLAAVPGSVLWLLGDNEAAMATLRREAETRAIDPARLVFAERAAQADHLARQRHADLFLDTAPVNAHTTASDALWVGLPVITFKGPAFIGRVAASVLAADGLEDLICPDIAAYEALALELARDPARLAVLRRRVAENRDRCLLFDTDRFRRHLEAAYEAMHARRLAGQSPEAFDVTLIGEPVR